VDDRSFVIEDAEPVGERLRRWWYRTPFHSWRLNSGSPGRLTAFVPDAWPGDKERGERYLSGAAAPGHDFAWLRDCAALGEERTSPKARMLVEDWLSAHADWDADSWRPEVLGTRLANIVTHARYLGLEGDDPLSRAVLSAAAAQAKHLAGVLPRDVSGFRLFAAVKGLIMWAAVAPEADSLLASGLRLLDQAMAAQIFPDGGHASRSPAIHMRVLRHLVDIRAALKAGQRPLPPTLQSAIDRMSPMLRFFRHGDGGLALFNDCTGEDPKLVELILEQAGAGGKPLTTAPHSGFQRLMAGRSLILIDCGPPASLDDLHSHAGTLSLEISIGKERLLSNCGAYRGDSPDWRQGQRATAAHNTICLEDTNSSQLLADGHIGQRPLEVESSRDEEERNIWVTASHDGYRMNLGTVHRRRVYLSASGEDIRVEDALIGRAGHEFSLRLHLPPPNQCSIIQNGAAALLRTMSGKGFRLRVSGGILITEESVSFDNKGKPRRAEQLVLRGTTEEGETVVKWGIAPIG
jgi:uncharacterized heparinase superfamily protein